MDEAIARIRKFKVKTLSADLAAITGRNKMNYPDTFKAVWAFIKKKGLSAKGRKLGAVGKVRSEQCRGIAPWDPCGITGS